MRHSGHVRALASRRRLNRGFRAGKEVLEEREEEEEEEGEMRYKLSGTLQPSVSMAWDIAGLGHRRLHLCSLEKASAEAIPGYIL